MVDYKYENNETTARDEGSTGKKVGLFLGAAVIAALVGVTTLYLVDVDQTQEARLPDVDVQVTEGQMPKFDVDVADVNIQTKEVEVDVPTMDVETETIEVEVPVDVDADTTTETISVPTINIDRPEEDDPADNPAG